MFSKTLALSLLFASVVLGSSNVRENAPRRRLHNRIVGNYITSNKTLPYKNHQPSPVARSVVTPPPCNYNPPDWPTVTQPADTYSATKTSPADPYLTSISQALDNTQNSLFTAQYTGDLTYYGQGQTSCGDVYTDQTYTAAISHLVYDSWPGATVNTNRNPICGPFTTGRNILNQSGGWDTVVADTEGILDIGGDGLPNCHAGSQCHIPLSATITNPATGKSVVVEIVDRCTGCQMGDIDVTPTAFSAIADMNSGRVHGITWHFNPN